MERFLTHTFSISDHPIKRFDKPFNIQYVMGLGEFMCYISSSNNRAKLLFEVWAYSILGYVPKTSWNYTFDWVYIKTALYRESDEIHFSLMRQSFVFDCFYLASTLDSRLTICTYTFLLDKVNGFFTRGILTENYKYFQGELFFASGSSIPCSLQQHRYLDIKFHAKPLKKILVVATMSAGKSTLINALVGYRINRIKTTACTSHLCYIYNKPYEDGLIVNIGDNKFVYSNDIEFVNSDYFMSAGLHFDSYLSSERICIIDTPGANYSKDISHGEITKQVICGNDYDAIIFVANGQYFATNDESELLDYTIQHTHKPIIFVLNQLDRFKQQNDSIKKMLNDFEKVLNDKKHHEPLIVPLSAFGALMIKLYLKASFLDDDELFELDILKVKFSRKYYFLENYTKYNFSKQKSILDHTGIFVLEKLIKFLQ
ncbi:dynamin family protein [Parabacteroides sp. BX2]|jgi:GTP-binding protein EngB required for normal cell division|uniref:Dynamin family protein n=1 Tax=Parabacteroides segnis TaxID=2763058 RepID=A0ABR7E6T1_9BACT|nr:MULTISPECIES: dynamin family protein [Parabacteroides]MBC5645457.1 dynamin family protein [Parabacteroides segnis]MCM0715341.1 dynamin family protein [Parabacteroides sp. TA-V-105]